MAKSRPENPGIENLDPARACPQWANLDLQAVELNLYFESIDTQMDPIQCDNFSPLRWPLSGLFQPQQPKVALDKAKNEKMVENHFSGDFH